MTTTEERAVRREGTLLSVVSDLDEAWPQGMPPENILVRVELDGITYVVDRITLHADEDGEVIVLNITKEKHEVR